MSLFVKTAEFERLCYQLLKRAQSNKGWKIDPETGKMVDNTSNTTVPAASLSGPTPRYSMPPPQKSKPKAAPNKSVDPNMSKKPSLQTQAPEVPLNPGAHPDLERVVRDTSPAPTKPAPARSAPQKSTQPPSWITKYIEEEKATTPNKSEPAVQKAINRSNQPLEMDTDRAAQEQVERATKSNPFGKQ